MSNAKLEALKALFKKEQEKKENGGKQRRGDVYPFWQMEVGQKAVVRLLPDKNPDNEFQFYVEKLEHKLSINGKDEKFPCPTMYGEKCPVCDLSREFYKAEGKESVNGKYYYRSKNFVVRFIVVEDPLLPDEETKETCVGKTMNSQFGFQLMSKIKEEISGDDIEDLPWDLQNGSNFNIKKTPQGKYGKYDLASGFVRKSTPVANADEIELIDLSTLLPANPGAEFVKRKLEAHLNGTEDTTTEEKETEVKATTATKPTVPAVENAPAPKVEAKVEAVTESEDDDSEEDILAKIRRTRAAAKNGK